MNNKVSKHDKNTQIEKYPDKDRLSLGAANLIVQLSRDAAQARGYFTIALAGGSSPKSLYELLATQAFKEKVDWTKWHVFIGDERLVPENHPDSNFGMAASALISHVPISNENIHQVNTAIEGEQAAATYESEIKQVFAGLDTAINSQLPRLDLILLGLGPDRHTLSLFPGKSALLEKNKLVVFTNPGVLPPPVDRVSLTLPVVNNARNIIFLVTGAEKAEAVADIIRNEPDYSRPASMVLASEHTKIVWMLDETASSRL